MVANDRHADWDTYATPLSPAEKADLDARQRNSDAIQEVIFEYGHDRPDWAGMYTDQLDHGRIVALFVGPVDGHRAWIASHVRPLAMWDVRQVRWSYTELKGFAARVAADEQFLRTAQASFVAVGPHVANNSVRLQISSRNPGAPAKIIEHFGGQEWLTVETDGIGKWDGPRGTLVVRVVDPGGVPIKDVTCLLKADVPSAYVSDDTDRPTGADGICRFPNVGATWFEIEAFTYVDNRKWVGRARALVAPGTTVEAPLVIGPG